MATITLHRGDVALVDDEDFERLNKHKWFSDKHGKTTYVVTYIDRRRVYMHRLIMNPPKGLVVDHVNRDGWDNRRSNLRICGYAQNNCNSIAKRNGFKGVVLHKQHLRFPKHWRAEIQSNNRRHSLGLFASEEEAARAYDAAAIRLHGEFARLNFPNG